MQLQLNREQIKTLRNIINNVWDNPAIKAPDMYKEVNTLAKEAGVFEEHQEFSDEGFRQSVATIQDENRNFANFSTRKRKLTVSVDFNLVEDFSMADQPLPLEPMPETAEYNYMPPTYNPSY